MNKILFEGKIQNLYSTDYEYLQDTTEDELKKLYRQIIQNPGVAAIIKGFNLAVSTTDATKVMIYHEGGWGGLISENADIIETQDILDPIAASDSTSGVENFVYVRLYRVQGTFNKSSETVEEGVKRNIDLYDYQTIYDREIDKWEVKVYTQAEVTALSSEEVSQHVCLGSFIANGTSAIETVTENGRTYVRSFIQEGSIQTEMIATEGFTLPQLNVQESQTINDDYSGTPDNLEDNLNNIRTVIKDLKGTSTWDESTNISLLDADSAANKLHGNGIIQGEWDEMEVIPASTGLAVVVQSGKALVQGDISHVLQGEELTLQLEPQTTFQVGDWETRNGEVHIVPALPSTVTLTYQNIGNLKITDKFGEPYPDGFREGIDYTVDYDRGIITIPPTIESRIALEEIHCYYEWGYTRYDLVEVGEGNDIRVITGTEDVYELPPFQSERYIPLAQIQVKPFYTSISSADITDNRTFAQYVRNLLEIQSDDYSDKRRTVGKLTYYTSSGEIDVSGEQWTQSIINDRDAVRTTTSGTRITTTISCLDNDEFWMLVDKTPWENTVTVEFNTVAGYQELGLVVNTNNQSGLILNTNYSFKVNGTTYQINSGANPTYSNVAALMEIAIRASGFGAEVTGGDIRITDALYEGLDSYINIDHCDTNVGDLFNSITGFIAFDTAVDGTDSPPTSGYQQLDLEITETDPCGLATNTSYHFKVNGTSYAITTGSTNPTYSNLKDLMHAAVVSDGFTVTLVSNTFPETGKDIKVTNTATGSSSTVALDFDYADLFNHLIGFTAIESAVDGELALSEYHTIDLSSKDTIEYYPIFVTKGFSEGYHTVRITVDEVRDYLTLYSVLVGKLDTYYAYELLYGRPETEPYKVTNYRDTLFKFYTQPSANRQAEIYLDDAKELCTSTGHSLNYWDVEQVYPVSRADNSLTIGGAIRLVTDKTVVINEDPNTATIVYFTPTATLLASEQHQRVGFYVSDKKSGWVSLEVYIHNSSNEQVGDTATILYANITDADWNYFEIDVDLTIGETYHYHILVVDRTSGDPPEIRAQVTTNAINFVEMYKPYVGKYKSSDIVNITNTSGTSIVSERLANGDPAGGRYDQSVLDIMGVDLSNDSIWSTWEYETYIGVDVRTGRVKFPSGYNANDYLIEFNLKDMTTDMDAKSILLHGENESVEDKFRKMQHESILFTMESTSTGAVLPGNIACIESGGTGRIDAFPYGTASSSRYYSVIGVCHSIPTVNKLGRPNPVNICAKGLVRVSTSPVGNGTWTVGDALYLYYSSGLLLNPTELNGATPGYAAPLLFTKIGVLTQIIDANTIEIYVT